MDLIMDRNDNERRAAATTTIRTAGGLAASTPSPMLGTSSGAPAPRAAVSASPIRSWRRSEARRGRDQTPAARAGRGTALPLEICAAQSPSADNAVSGWCVN